MKTIVIMVSKYFPAYHPRAGEPTKFKEKILSGEKIHTIRGNYDLWKKRIDQVIFGDAILSLRQWDGKPYNSKQVEIKQLFLCDVIGVQKIDFKGSLTSRNSPIIDDKYLVSEIPLAVNDGLTVVNFDAWFKPYDLSKPMAIIHFTGFRY